MSPIAAPADRVSAPRRPRPVARPWREPPLLLQPAPGRWPFFFGKRLFDIAVSSLLLALLSPVIIILSAAICLDSKGWPFYRQQRKGRFQRPFGMLKFRTMHVGAHALRSTFYRQSETDGILFKMVNDPRMTRLGPVLRKFSLDELPQLINVLKGEMSLVGPRPFSVEIFSRAEASGPLYRRWLTQRHTVRPGMTGLWQVSGRFRLKFHQLVALDLRYVRRATLALDFLTLVRTIATVMGGTGA